MVSDHSSDLYRQERFRDEVRQRAEHIRRSDLTIRRNQTRRFCRKFSGKTRKAPHDQAVPTQAATHGSSPRLRAASGAAGRAVRRPLVNTPNRSSRSTATCWSPRVATRVAARSMANGIPSRRRQIAAIAGRFSSFGAKSEHNALVVAMKKLHRTVTGYIAGLLVLRGAHPRQERGKRTRPQSSVSPGSLQEWSFVDTAHDRFR